MLPGFLKHVVTVMMMAVMGSLQGSEDYSCPTPTP